MWNLKFEFGLISNACGAEFMEFRVTS